MAIWPWSRGQIRRGMANSSSQWSMTGFLLRNCVSKAADPYSCRTTASTRQSTPWASSSYLGLSVASYAPTAHAALSARAGHPESRYDNDKSHRMDRADVEPCRWLHKALRWLQKLLCGDHG